MIIITSIESAADFWTWDGVLLQAWVDHVDRNYLLYQTVEYGKRAWRLFGTIFKEIRAHRGSAQGCFGLTGAEGCCGGSAHGFWEKFHLPVARGSDTQTKRKERGNVVASPFRSIIKDQVEAGISAIALPCRGTMRWCGHSVFWKPKAIILVLAFLEADFNKGKSSSGSKKPYFTDVLFAKR